MKKFSKEFKLKIVQEYLLIIHNFKKVAANNNQIVAATTIKSWVRIFNAAGISGLEKRPHPI